MKRKVAIVTGSSKGIGASCIIEFAKKGYDVVINYNKSKEKALKLQDEIKKYTNEKLGLKNETTEDLHVKESNLQAILKGMKGVTSEGGTAYSAFANFDIEVGGKTGSAQTGDGKDAHAWFVGFSPYDNPEIAVVVLVEHGGTGGYTAGVARDIMKEYFGMNSKSVTENVQATLTTQSVR